MLSSDLIFSPKKRAEIWRFYTYQFLHAGFPHIFGNVLMQLFLGIPLELVHGSIRLGIKYVLCIYSVRTNYKFGGKTPIITVSHRISAISNEISKNSQGRLNTF